MDDIVGRLGEDEFIALMYGVSTRKSLSARLRSCVRASGPSWRTPLQRGFGKHRRGHCPEHGDSFEELYARLMSPCTTRSKGGQDPSSYTAGIRPGFRKERRHGLLTGSAVSMENRLSDGCRRRGWRAE